MTCCNKKDKEDGFIHEAAPQIEQIVDEYVALETVLNNLKEVRKKIRELKETVSNHKDSLELIFEKQAELLKHLNEQKPDNYYNGPERYPFEKVMHMMTAMSDEFSEVRAAIPWKHWKTYEENNEDDSCCSGAPNKLPENFLALQDLEATQRQIISNSKLEYLQKEWIDIGHFYIQGAIELGITPKKFLELYLNKNKENQERYDSNY